VLDEPADEHARETSVEMGQAHVDVQLERGIVVGIARGASATTRAQAALR
jgi:hypothetical protein